MTWPRRTTGDRNLGVDLIHVTQWCDHRAVTTGAPDRTHADGPLPAAELAPGREDRGLRGGRHHHGPGRGPEVPAEPDLAGAASADVGRLRGHTPAQERPEDAVDPGHLPRRLGAHG